MSQIRVRLDYTRPLTGFHQDYYTILPTDTTGDLARLDAQMERLRKQHVPAVLYILNATDQIDLEEGYQGIVGGIEEPDAGLPHWQRWREPGLA